MRYKVFSIMTMSFDLEIGEVTVRMASTSSSDKGDEEKTPTMLAWVERWRGWR